MTHTGAQPLGVDITGRHQDDTNQDQDSTNWYIDLCDAAGLSAVSCADSYGTYQSSQPYSTNSQYTQDGRGGGGNGWAT